MDADKGEGGFGSDRVWSDISIEHGRSPWHNCVFPDRYLVRQPLRSASLYKATRLAVEYPVLWGTMGTVKGILQDIGFLHFACRYTCEFFHALFRSIVTRIKRAGTMKSRNLLAIFISLLSTGWAIQAVADGNTLPSCEEARQASWMLTSELVKILGEGDVTKWPGTHAWLKDLRNQTKGIDKDTPVAKWPEVDIGALVDHNPNFWWMYYEIAPGDPMLTLIHAGLLLSQGEAMRAAYILELGQHWPGIPKSSIHTMQSLQATAMASLKASDDITKAGIKLFDQGDYSGAIKKYREALNLCPQNGWASYELGYTLRTQTQVARGETPAKPGMVTTDGKMDDLPEVTAAFAESRHHDPLQFMAYQGSDPQVIKGCLAIVQQVRPAWTSLRKEGITREAEYHALGDLSEGFQEAGVYDLAIFCRQLMAAHRNSYDPDDYPIIAASLRKLSPGKKIEDILARLAGKELALRPLTKQEKRDDGLPGLGNGLRVYMPDKPASKDEKNKSVHVDHIHLLTNQDAIAKRTTIDDFAKFNKEFDKIADEVLAKCNTPCKVLVRFTCTPSGHTVKIMHQPKDIDEEPLEAMHEAIARMEKLPVTEETVEFQIHLTVTPKSSLPNK
ncbi:MAG: tetratricopeptide repeat protein [Pirellulales bacterium]|nr:tetratricopeptide repeat protein [Pirellulales bacterium]